MRAITRSTVRRLWRMKWRTVAISLVVAVAMSMFVSGFYGAAVLDASVDRFFKDNRMPDLFVELSEPANETEVAGALDEVDGVAVYDLRLTADGVYDPEDREVQALIIGVKIPGWRDIARLDVQDGHLPTAPGEGVAVTGVEDLGIEPGADCTFQVGNSTFELRISGTVTSPEFVFPSAYVDYGIPFSGSLVIVFMTIGDLRDLTGLEGVNDIILIVDREGADREAAEALEPFGVDSATYRADHPSVVMMETGSGKMRSMFPLLGVLFLFIGFISIFMTMMRLVQNDSRFIGVLMSLGYRRSEIVRSYMAMAMAIVVVASVLGSLLALLMTQGIVAAGSSLYMELDIVLPFDPAPFLLGTAITAGMVAFSVLLPVMLITRSSVREALEYRPRTRVLALRLGTGRLSRVTLLGLRNTFRTPWRTAVTVLVVGMTIGVAGSWIIMMDSAVDYMEVQIEADTWDLGANFDAPTPAGNVTAASVGLTGSETEYVIPYTQLVMQAGSGTERSGATVIGCDDCGAIRDFDVRDGSLDFTRAVLTTLLADDLGVGPGDTITLVLGTATLDIEVSAVIYHGFMNGVYTERSNLAPFYSPANCSGAYVKLADAGTDREAATAMRNTPGVSRVIVHSEIADALDDIMVQAMSFLYVFFLLFLLVTVVVAGSAVILATMERDVEYATLDTLGIPRRKVRGTILMEMSLLALMSASVGIPLAYVFAELLVSVLAEVIYWFPVLLTVGAVLITFTMGAAFVMLSSLIPIRYSSKLDTEKTFRERTAG